MKQIIPFKQELLFKTKISEITSISLEHTLSLKEDDLISGEFLITGDYKMTEGSINREKFSFKLPFEIALDSRYDINNIVIDIDNFYYEVINNESLQVNIDVYFEGEKKEEQKEVAYINEQPIETQENTPDTETEQENNERNKVELEEDNTKENQPQDEVSIVNEHNKNIIEKNIDYTKIDKELELTENTTTKDNTNNDNLSHNDISTTNKEDITLNDKTNLTINNDFNIFENIDNSDTYVTYHVYIVKEDDNINTITEKYGVTKEEISNYNDITTINPGDKIIIPYKNE